MIGIDIRSSKVSEKTCVSAWKDALLGSNRSDVSLRVGINCTQIYPAFVGGVNTYALGLLEGFASAGNGCRFQVYVTDGNQHLFEEFRKYDKFDVVGVGGRLLSMASGICRATLLSS